MPLNEDIRITEQIALAVKQADGQVYYVGGCVRDALLGLPVKDIDIEVHGVPCDTLRSILSGIGTPIVKGASFGVFGLRGSGIDIALPRTEKCSGRGHRDFEIFTDPFISPEAASGRRDFTVNAMMRDVLTGKILDFYGGMDDLRAGVIRHVLDRSFVEDPLRVLRAAQFSARFGFSVAEETVRLCRTMDLTALSRERVMQELSKALLGAVSPSVFFLRLQEMDHLGYWFPEVRALIGVRQDPSFHPEGDVYTHTMLVLDAAAGLLPQAKQPLPFMLSALCHDFGKPFVTLTHNGKIHAYGHEDEGVPAAQAMIERLTTEHSLKKYVLNMVQHHMRPNLLVCKNAGTKAYMKMFDLSCEPEDLLLLARADFEGCGLGTDYAPYERKLTAMLAEYRSRMALPGVTGQDLLDAGLAPGPEFKDALDFAHKMRLAGMDRDESLRQTLGYLRSGKRKR